MQLVVLLSGGAGAVGSWTPPFDIDLTAASYNGSGDIAVSTQQEFDINSIASAAFEVYSQLIVMFQATSSGGQTIPLSTRVLEGESIFFSADNNGILVLTYNSAE